MAADVRRTLLVIVVVLSSLFCTMCTTLEKTSEPIPADHGQITVYLNGPDKATVDITFDVQSIEIIAEDGRSRDVLDQPLSINALTVKGKQVFLGEESVPQGKYTELRIAVTEASLRRKGRVSKLALPPEGVMIPIEMEVTAFQNTTIFIEWSADASIIDGFQFDPVFGVKGEVPEVNSLLMYVTNEGSDNVSVINRQLNEVVGTILVGRSPRGVAVGTLHDRRKVYVANSASNSVSVIDVTTGQVENEIPIRHGMKPVDVAVIPVSGENELIFVANNKSDTVSVIDLRSLRETLRINTGNGPSAIAVDPPIEAFLDSDVLTFEGRSVLRSFFDTFVHIYVANKNANNVSIITLDTVNRSVTDVVEVPVGWSPVGVTVDPERGKVLVANNSSSSVSLIDIVEITKGNLSGAVDAINNIGYSNAATVTDPVFERLYLLKDRPGEIVIIRTFADAADSADLAGLFPTMGSIPLGGETHSLAFDPEKRSLYVVNRSLHHVSVIDKTTKKETVTIPVGKKPYDIAVVPY